MIRIYLAYFLTVILLLLNVVEVSAAGNDYKIGPGDTIKISVYDEPDLTVQTKVSKSGVVNFPFLDDIEVVGLTSKEIETKVYEGLLGDYLIHPQISVSIINYRPFFIHGQVKQPGGYPYQEDLTLDKAIAIAGGLGTRASKTDWKLTRILDGKTVTIKVDITTRVQPDDIIKIEQTFF